MADPIIKRLGDDAVIHKLDAGGVMIVQDNVSGVDDIVVLVPIEAQKLTLWLCDNGYFQRPKKGDKCGTSSLTLKATMTAKRSRSAR